jgi:hypothetical protein
MFKEIIAVYSDNHTKPINTLMGKVELLIIKAGGTWSYQWDLERQICFNAQIIVGVGLQPIFVA